MALHTIGQGGAGGQLGTGTLGGQGGQLGTGGQGGQVGYSAAAKAAKYGIFFHQI